MVVRALKRKGVVPITLTATGGVPASTLAVLHCPYCESPLEIVVSSENDTQLAHSELIQDGVLRCACSEYPVLAGIPILQHTPGLERIVRLVREGRNREALLRALNIFRVKWARRSRLHQLQYLVNCRRLIRHTDLSFMTAADLVRRPQVFSDYLAHRYANPSLLAALPTIPLLGDLSGSPAAETQKTEDRRFTNLRVLDLACGAGHASYLIRSLFPELPLFSADHDFVSLYLAKKFLAPDATHVCYDSEGSSPFPDNFFSAVFCLDAFHYFHAKSAVLTELQRVVDCTGIWIFPHLHNALQHNVTAGVPVSPEHYLRLFSALDPRILSEDDILHKLATDEPIDWCARNNANDLHAAPTLTLIGGRGRRFGLQKSSLSAYSRQQCRLAINPIYRVSEARGGASLHRAWPNSQLRAECARIEAYLPETVQLDTADLQAISDGDFRERPSRAAELLRQFVLVPLSANYV